ncbi:hypothetical protein GQX73_g5901 [Xylaria multiplex]|uniref:Heterokaryon incompatibility domain-containing protein n=1 Tax=Xylaria multiplex TaxID=323545 RepID=A0A7C8MQ38_9PEZI|nr:hypothetical protein GQX73_g5901 [Xylaria multiplex]
MRLIDIKTLQFKEFHHKFPPYAILSHTWGSEEVTYQEYLLATGPDASRHSHIKRKQGFLKILGACKRAERDGLGYLWCDTNCIDKSSSAELTEAINSMYAWYRDSTVCYALLMDVGINDSRDPVTFAKSKWFTRGWTLQELLAPKKVVFFDGHWNILGDRARLAQIISEITRIHIGVLHDRNTVFEYSIAQRMSWAANRQTTRLEDIAYCLLGIFDINMPLLYGEGAKAFTRLQQEIIKVSDDQSILVWEPRDNRHQTSVLARSPNEFYFCGSIIRDPDIGRKPFALTNMGLSVKLTVIKSAIGGFVLAGLNCSRELLGRNINGDGKVLRRAAIRTQAWIWLRVVAHDIYERVHLSSSTVFLADPFESASECSSQSMFIQIEQRSFTLQGSALPPLLPPRHHATSAGLCLTIGFGLMRPRIHRLETAYLPGNFLAVVLRPKGYLCVSYEIISSENFSVIASIAWDKDGKPKKWQYTAFYDPEPHSSFNSYEREGWGFLSGDKKPDDLIRNIDPETEMMSTHQLIRSVRKTDQTSNPQPPIPFVKMGKESFDNLHGQAGVAVEIIFQEPPKRKYMY